jgi:hypothetical protein
MSIERGGRAALPGIWAMVGDAATAAGVKVWTGETRRVRA